MKKLIIFISLMIFPISLCAQEYEYVGKVDKGFVSNFHTGTDLVLNHKEYVQVTTGVALGYAFNKTFSLSALIDGTMGLYGKDGQGTYMGNLVPGLQFDVDFCDWIGVYAQAGSTVINRPYEYMYGGVGIKLLDDGATSFFGSVRVGVKYQHSYKAAFDNDFLLYATLDFPLWRRAKR